MRGGFRLLGDILDGLLLLVAAFALLTLVTSLATIGTGAFVELALYLLVCLAIPACGAAAADRIARR